MKILLASFLIGLCLVGVSSAEISHYSRNEISIKFDGKVKKTSIHTHYYIFGDVDPEKFSNRQIAVPHLGELRNVLITIKGKEPKAKEYTKKDGILLSASQPFELVSDSKFYQWDFDKIEPGTEIDCLFELEERDGLGGDYLAAVEDLPVDTTLITISYPKDKWRLKYSIDRGEPVRTDSLQKMTFTWYNLKARNKFEKAPTDFLPGLWYLFESKTDKADIHEWQDVYRWAQEQLVTSQTAIDTAKMLAIASTPEQILAAIDKQCHYVAIEIGKGSYVPSLPDDVWSKGYGDCKGLANLFMNWIRIAGYQSWQVLVLASDDYYGNIDFPSQGMFNHMIAAYITSKGDTAYQDLTAEYCPLGYLPTQLFGCLAYPILPNANPRRLGTAPIEPDTLSIVINGDMTPDGILVGKTNLRMKGREPLQWKWLYDYTRTLDKEKVTRGFVEAMLPTCTFRKIVEDSAASDEIKLTGDINIRRFAVDRDSVVAFKPWGLEFLRDVIKPDTSRYWPTVLKRNLLCQVSYQVQLAQPVYSLAKEKSAGLDYDNFSYKILNRSHDDSLLVQLELYLPPKTFSPQELSTYLDNKKSLLRALDGEATFLRNKP